MKKLTLLSLILLLAHMAGAQEYSVKTQLIQDFERSKELTISYLNAMPAEKYEYKPAEDVRTFAEQMLHAAQGTIGLVSNGCGTEKILVGINLEKDAERQSKERVIETVTQSFDYAIKSIESLDESTLGEVITKGKFNITRLGWIMKACEHVVHHRGQIAVYLRMNDLVPPTYRLF